LAHARATSNGGTVGIALLGIFGVIINDHSIPTKRHAIRSHPGVGFIFARVPIFNLASGHVTTLDGGSGITSLPNVASGLLRKEAKVITAVRARFQLVDLSYIHTVTIITVEEDANNGSQTSLPTAHSLSVGTEEPTEEVFYRVGGKFNVRIIDGESFSGGAVINPVGIQPVVDEPSEIVVGSTLNIPVSSLKISVILAGECTCIINIVVRVPYNVHRFVRSQCIPIEAITVPVDALDEVVPVRFRDLSPKAKRECNEG